MNKRFFRYYLREFRRFNPAILTIMFSDLEPSEYLKSLKEANGWNWEVDDIIEPGRILPMSKRIELIHEIDKDAFDREDEHSIPIKEFHFPDLANI